MEQMTVNSTTSSAHVFQVELESGCFTHSQEITQLCEGCFLPLHRRGGGVQPLSSLRGHLGGGDVVEDVSFSKPLKTQKKVFYLVCWLFLFRKSQLKNIQTYFSFESRILAILRYYIYLKGLMNSDGSKSFNRFVWQTKYIFFCKIFRIKDDKWLELI